MAFKTVLSVIGVDQSDRDLLLAIELCRKTDAHLSVLDLAIASPPPIGEYAAVISEAWIEERREENAKLASHLDRLRETLGASDISADIESEYVEQAWADDVAGRRARYADLTLVGPELNANDKLKNLVLKGVLFNAQRPVLVVPEGSPVSLRPKNVMIAWNSSLEASRAVREALDLIAGAQTVNVTMVDPEATERGAGQEPGADIAAYLARHGARVTVDRVPCEGRSVAETLRAHAVDHAADMMVMGAYGHSRLRERVLGGTTHAMIENPTLPVFMAK